MEPHLLLSTEAQERLSALLTKAVDVLPFANDEACNRLFTHLAEFCSGALSKKNTRQEAKFSSMKVEDLIALAQDMNVTSSALRTEESEQKSDKKSEKKEKTSPSVSAQKKRKGLTGGKRVDGPGRLDAEGQGSSDAEGQSKKAATKWEFEKAYNIVEVTKIQEDPFVIHVLARPPVAGNQKARAYYMESNDFDTVGEQKGRPGTKLKKRFLAALGTYCRSLEAVPAFFIDKIDSFEWSKSLASELKGESDD